MVTIVLFILQGNIYTIKLQKCTRVKNYLSVVQNGFYGSLNL